MAQLHFYVPDSVAEKIHAKAEKEHLSVSKYMAKLAKREVEAKWPSNYFECFGQWQSGSLERPQQPPIEQREIFD